jgi:hypothetical protein
VRIITPLDTVLLGIGFTVNGVVNSVSVWQVCVNVPARSQSVGLAGDNRSPKRQPRTPLAAATQPSKVNGPVQTERRPRPSK